MTKHIKAKLLRSYHSRGQVIGSNPTSRNEEVVSGSATTHDKIYRPKTFEERWGYSTYREMRE